MIPNAPLANGRLESPQWQNSILLTVVGLTLSLSVASYYVAVRTGLRDNGITSAISFVLISIVLQCFPEMLRRWKTGLPAKLPEALSLICGLAAIVLLSFLPQVVAWWGLCFSAVLGIFCLAEGMFKEKVSCLKVIPLVALSALLGVLVISQALRPLLFEGFAVGVCDQDALFHADLSNILLTHGVPSTALHGIPFTPYHFGSHWLAGRLCMLTGRPVLDFYTCGFGITMVPLFIRALCTFSVSCARFMRPMRTQNLPPLYWLVLSVGVTGVLPLSFARHMAPSSYPAFASESYSVSLVLFFLISSVLLEVPHPNGGRSTDWWHTCAQGFSLSLSCVLLTLSKISTGFLFLILCLYNGVRWKRFRKPKNLLPLALIILSFALTQRLASWAQAPEFQWCYLFSSVIEPHWEAGFVLFWHAWLLIIACTFAALQFPKLKGLLFDARFGSPILAPIKVKEADLVGVASGRTLAKSSALPSIAWGQLQSKSSTDTVAHNSAAGNLQMLLENAVILACVGAAIALSLKVECGSGLFFWEVQSWFALALVLASTIALSPETEQTIKKVSLLPVLLIVLLSVNIFNLSGRALIAPLEARLILIRQTNLVHYWRYWTKPLLIADCQSDLWQTWQKALPLFIGAFTSPIQSILDESPTYRRLCELKQFDSLSETQKRDTVIYIPRRSQFWSTLAGTNTVFLAPALTGISQLWAQPAAECKADFFLCPLYDPRPSQAELVAIKPEEVRAESRRRGFQNMITTDADDHFHLVHLEKSPD